MKVILDANVILRFLLADHPTHSLQARKLFEKAASGTSGPLFISAACAAEVPLVLTSFYKHPRKDVSQALQGVFLHAGVEAEHFDLLMTACDFFAKFNVDFIDCYHAAATGVSDGELATFDRDFRKFTDLKLMKW